MEAFALVVFASTASRMPSGESARAVQKFFRHGRYRLEPRAAGLLEGCSLMFGIRMVGFASRRGDRMSAVRGMADMDHLGSDAGN